MATQAEVATMRTLNADLDPAAVAAVEAGDGITIPGQRIDEPDATAVTAPSGVVKTSVFDRTPAAPIPGSSVGRHYKPGLGWVNGDNQPIAEPASRLNPAVAPVAAEAVEPAAEEEATTAPEGEYRGLGSALRVAGAAPMNEEDEINPALRQNVAELRREIEEPGAVAFEKAYAQVLAHYNITAYDNVPAEVEAEATREGNKARAAAEAGEEVLPPINRPQGTVYGTAPEKAADPADDATDVEPVADPTAEPAAEVEDDGEDHSEPADATAQEYAGRHRAEDREDSPETGFRAWTRRRFSGAMRLAKWAFDKSGLPTKEELTKTATVGAMASAVLADQVGFEARQLWRNELKPGLQAVVRDVLGKAAMRLDSKYDLGAGDMLQTGWQKYLEHDARRSEQAAAAEAARIQAFQDEAARSQAEWAQNNLSR